MRDEQPSGAVLAQVPAVAVGAAVKLLAAGVVHCELLGAGINSCPCGWFRREAAHSILMIHRNRVRAVGWAKSLTRGSRGTQPPWRSPFGAGDWFLPTPS